MCTKFQVSIIFRLARRCDTHKCTYASFWPVQTKTFNIQTYKYTKNDPLYPTNPLHLILTLDAILKNGVMNGENITF